MKRRWRVGRRSVQNLAGRHCCPTPLLPRVCAHCRSGRLGASRRGGQLDRRRSGAAPRCSWPVCANPSAVSCNRLLLHISPCAEHAIYVYPPMVETERLTEKTPLKQREPLHTTAYGPPRGKNAIILQCTRQEAAMRPSHNARVICVSTSAGSAHSEESETPMSRTPFRIGN